MQVQVTTDNNITGGESLVELARDTIEDRLGHYRDRLTRVIVHFTDENSHKGGEADRRCAIEVRPAGLKPLAATHLADDLDQALDGAIDRLLHVLEHTFGRLDEHKGRTPMGGQPL
jgi:ribosome-associated translation inhibitor RaiA